MGLHQGRPRVLLDVCPHRRKRRGDWPDLDKALTRIGRHPLRLVATDGAPGRVRTVQELWPDANRQRRTVHRLRNILAKLPKAPALHEWVRKGYWPTLDQAEDKAMLLSTGWDLWLPIWSVPCPAPPRTWPTTSQQS